MRFEMGRKSDCIDIGGWTFGIGRTSAIFPTFGQKPFFVGCCMLVLNIAQTGSHSNDA